MVTNVSSWFRRSAALHSNRTAIHFNEKSLSYAKLEAGSNQLANALIGLGLRRGERVAVYMDNCIEIVMLELACYKTGLVKTPVNARLSSLELQHVLNNAQASCLLTSSDRVDALSAIVRDVPSLRQIISVDMGGNAGQSFGLPMVQNWTRLLDAASDTCAIVDVEVGDLAVLHYTSGSSGVLKAAMQTYGNRLAQLRKFCMSPDGRLSPGDLLGLVGPITHASGMQLMPALCSGASVRLFSRFDPAGFVRAVESEKITHTFMVPTMINMVLALQGMQDKSLASLKRLGYGASPMAPARIEEAISRFGPILMQGYGAGETTSGVCTLSTQDHINALRDRPERLASCGRPYYETEVRVLNAEGQPTKPGEVGEIVVRGDDVFAGYWNAPELTAEVLIDGAYFTGDMATVDEDGYIFIVDRKKDMVISGGFNVYPTEVEMIIYTHPDVYEACVFAVPDEQWGEVVGVEIVLKAGTKLNEAGLKTFCDERLASFKRPRVVRFVDNLPKNQNGKMDRRSVQKKYWEGRSRQVN
jgi:acyl-CoA synthetase (AMP-forming)/AMP-acid ligase II